VEVLPQSINMAPGFLSLALLALLAPAEALAPDGLTEEPFVVVECFVSSVPPNSFELPAQLPGPDPRPQACPDEDDAPPDDPKTPLARPSGPRSARVFDKPRGAPRAVNAPPLGCSTALIYALGTLLL
jgi:hypothetical protein